MNCLRVSVSRKMRRASRTNSRSAAKRSRAGHPFCAGCVEIERALEWANASLTMSAEVHHAFTLSAEWLLDNAYLIREQVTDLRESLPQKHYGELPLIASGPEAGLPRVYQVASEIVAESGGALESGDHPEISGRFSSDHAAGHRRTLGAAADVAIAVARMSARRSRSRSSNSKARARRPIFGRIGSSPPCVTVRRDCSG